MSFSSPGKSRRDTSGWPCSEYSHSTAPNRRFPDLITQRLLKAALAGDKLPYDPAELTSLATHCTEQEDAAKKVERQVRKSAAAQFLSGRIGETFDALVTGASEKGTWVRLLKPPVEGKLTSGHEGVDVGDQIKVRLVSLNIERGFIDFVRSGNETPIEAVARYRLSASILVHWLEDGNRRFSHRAKRRAERSCRTGRKQSPTSPPSPVPRLPL